MLKTKNAYIMIETLIAIIVFSVAMIGLLSLQLLSLNSTQSSGNRVFATNYAYDLVDKMRSNQDGSGLDYYIAGVKANNSCRVTNYNTKNTVANCSSQQMAQDDLQEFFSEVASLPNGKAVVCLDSQRSQGTPTSPNCDGLGTAVVIKIFWKDSSSKSLATNDGFSQLIVGSEI